MPFPSTSDPEPYAGTGSFTSHDVNWGTTAAGDLILCVYTNGQTGSITRPAEFSNTIFSTSYASGRMAVWAVVADGTESGTFTVTHGSTNASAHVYRIANGSWGGTISTDVLAGTADTGTSDISANPPNLDTGTTDEYLWLEVGAIDAAVAWGGPSSGFSNLVSTPASSQVSLGSARQESETQALNPGTWSFTGTHDQISNTIAIRGTPSEVNGVGSAAITLVASGIGASTHAAVAASALAVSAGAGGSAIAPMAPSVSSYSPTVGQTGVSTTANLVITFGEDVTAGSGNVYLKRLADETIAEQWAIGDAEVDITGAVVTINPSTTLRTDILGYYVEWDGGAILADDDNAPHAGISGRKAWWFSCATPNSGNPLLVSNRLTVAV